MAAARPAAWLAQGRGRDDGGRAVLPVHETKGADPPAAGQGAGAEAGGSILNQPVHSIPRSRAAGMLALVLEADGGLEGGAGAGKSLMRCITP